MSDSETPTKKSWLPRLRLSAAAKAAVLVALSLLVTTLVAWWMYAADSSRVAWSDYMTLERGLTIALLFCATVASTYFVARLWFEQIPASETAFEKAWRAGEQALARHGINLQETPLFIVLGVADRNTMDNILESSGQKILESGVPKSEAPLRWFLTISTKTTICNSFAKCSISVSGKPFSSKCPVYRNSRQCWNALGRTLGFSVTKVCKVGRSDSTKGSL